MTTSQVSQHFNISLGDLSVPISQSTIDILHIPMTKSNQYNITKEASEKFNRLENNNQKNTMQVEASFFNDHYEWNLNQFEESEDL